jgi:hypothetical protein
VDLVRLHIALLHGEQHVCYCCNKTVEVNWICISDASVMQPFNRGYINRGYKSAVPDYRASPFIMRPSILMTLMALLLLMMHITLSMSDQTFCFCHRCYLLIRSAQAHTWVQPFFIYIPESHTQVYAILDKGNGFGCSVEQSAHDITCKVQAALKQWTCKT